jgi:hypothetical protein
VNNCIHEGFLFAIQDLSGVDAFAGASRVVALGVFDGKLYVSRVASVCVPTLVAAVHPVTPFLVGV